MKKTVTTKTVHNPNTTQDFLQGYDKNGKVTFDILLSTCGQSGPSFPVTYWDRYGITCLKTCDSLQEAKNFVAQI